MHAVYTAGNIVTVFLSNVLHTPAFGEEAADKTVIILVGATLTGGIRVAVVESRDQGLSAVCVLELRAIIYRDALEGVRRKAAKDFLKGGDSSGRGLGGVFKDDFKAGHALCEDEDGLFLSTGFAYHAVHFPVTKGGTAGGGALCWCLWGP